MSEIQKISIRFFDDREVRAIWDEEGAKWWFSVLDIVGVLNAQDDYAKNRNYWKYLKTKLRKNGSELVSATNQLKLLASDGKRYLTDVLDNAGVMLWRRVSRTIRRPDSLNGSPTATKALTAKAGRRHTLCLRAALSTVSRSAR